MRRLLVAPSLLAALMVAVVSATAVAQPGYPPGPPRNAGRCVRIQVNGNNHGPNNIPPGASGQVSGLDNCADPNEIGVQLFVEDGGGNRTLLSTFNAGADGSYTSTAFSYPAAEGDYNLVVVTQDGEVVRPINVGTPGGGGGPPASASRGGAFLSMWMLLLLAIATMLVLSARRKVPWLHPMRAMGARLRGRDAHPPALPAPDVPFLDTSHFVPQGMRARPEKSDALTEADV